MAQLTAAERREYVRRWKLSRTAFCAEAMKVRSKGARIEPLVLRPYQIEFNRRCDMQWAERGYVRVILVKGRQMGMSTTIAARFMHRAIFQPGVRAAILCHIRPATNNLSRMAKTFIDHAPAFIRPALRNKNQHELLFESGSEYSLTTAGSSGTGRSSTLNLFHGSEVAFWDNPEEHLAGIGQTLNEGTGEIILESTGNGLGNAFHKDWLAAERGDTDYEPIFLPWWLADEYRLAPPRGFSLSDVASGDMESEAEYARLHGLDKAQMYWRRRKIAGFAAKGTPNLFMQEYPATPQEAFQGGSGSQFISGKAIIDARRREVPLDDVLRMPLVIGVDPAWSARDSADSSALIRRRGRKAYGLEVHHGLDGHGLAQVVAKIAAEEHPDRIVVDRNGVGASCLDFLRRMAPTAAVTVGFHAGERALAADRYVDRRTECWDAAAHWLDEDADIPDDEAFASEALGPRMGVDTRNRRRLESKTSMRSRGLSSPNRAEAWIVTFAYADPPARLDDALRGQHFGRDWSPFDDGMSSWEVW